MKTDETKLMTNPDVKKKFLDALSQGVPIRVACMYARINQQTYANYRKRAEEGQQEYIDFIEEVDELLAKVQIKLVSEINNGRLVESAKVENGKIVAPAVYEADSLWTRKAWILERRFRKDWGRESQNEDNAEEKKSIEINVNFAGVTEVAKS